MAISQMPINGHALIQDHPFKSITPLELKACADILRAAASDRHQVDPSKILFKNIAIREPAKHLVLEYLEDVRAQGDLATSTKHLPRHADVDWYVEGHSQIYESVLCLDTHTELSCLRAGEDVQSLPDWAECRRAREIIKASPVWKAAVQGLGLPDDVVLFYDIWPRGADKFSGPVPPRLLRAIVHTRGPEAGHVETNRYAYPLPISPIVDIRTEEVVGVEDMPTNGDDPAAPISSSSHGGNLPKELSWNSGSVLSHCRPSDYHNELLSARREAVRPIVISQPEGVSFKVTDASLVEWQKWSFRVSFTAREGMVVHDVRYDNRSLFYRLSLSEVMVPYGDPRSPYHTKQAFDLGDCGAGSLAHSLEQGCDCLGSIYYFDGCFSDTDGNVHDVPNAICLHEVDNGVAWKHLSDATGVAVSTRSRQLVLQSMMTVGNYDYTMAWTFDESANLSYEAKATGILSTNLIDAGKVSRWGTVVAPGILSQNHQHFFCLRIDPALDGHCNTMQIGETFMHDPDDILNPHGNAWEVRKRPILTAGHIDADPLNGRTFTVVNESVLNKHSGNPVGYQIIPPVSQLLLAHPASVVAQRAPFAQHHVWVTGYHDGDLWAGGKHTTNSIKEDRGILSYVAKSENVRNQDIVVWANFGMTHVPRTEEYPIMSVQGMSVHFRPVDFFPQNPALDMPQHVSRQ